MNSPTTYLRRKTYGDKSWNATSTECFDLNGRTAQLQVSTSKNDRGQLVTTASIGFVTSENVVTTTIFSDYFARLELSIARCTEKAVSQQHDRAVRQWARIKADVREFYATKAAE